MRPGSSMNDHPQSVVTQPSRGASGQVKEAASLKLQTIGPANLAYLKNDGKGRVFLYFRGLLYGVDDYVPASLISPFATAGEFVCRQMLARYGDQEDEWPDVARQFLLQHTMHQSARRADSRR